MSPSLNKIQQLIDNGQKKQARLQLKKMIHDNPTADVWYMTALAVESERDQVKCLQKALQIDALHTPANRLLNQIKSRQQPQQQYSPPTKAIEIDREKKVNRTQQKGRSKKRRVGCGCLMSLLFSSVVSIVTLSIVGMIPGTIGAVTQLAGRGVPVYTIEDIPIEQVADSLFQIAPSLSEPLSAQQVNFIDHGYVHEYYFDVTAEIPFGVYLQFLSLNANNLNLRVALVDSTGNNVTQTCQQQAISEYDSGIAYVCYPLSTGRWTVRLLGVTGETIGGYIVGMQSIS